MTAFHRFSHPLALALLLDVAGAASAGDLVSHNGFAQCWEKAISQDQFLDAARSGIDGSGACVPAQSGNSPAPFSLCDTNACVGAQQGCPVTLHASSAPTGNFINGSFGGSGTVSDIPVHLVVFGVPCTLTITGISFNYNWNNTLYADGNSGKYAADLPGVNVGFNAYTVGGNCQGSVNSLFGATAATAAQNAVAAAITPLLTAATVTESVCPLQ